MRDNSDDNVWASMIKPWQEEESMETPNLEKIKRGDKQPEAAAAGGVGASKGLPPKAQTALQLQHKPQHSARLQWRRMLPN
jgi:hypothetical protein